MSIVKRRTPRTTRPATAPDVCGGAQRTRYPIPTGRAILLAVGICLASVLAAPAPASAGTYEYSDLGYPDKSTPCAHSPYAASGACQGYDWGPVKDSDPAWDRSTLNSGRGYGYRNCTDYVAWRLQSLGVNPARTTGLGNGGQWYDKAAGRLDRGDTPAAGAAAVRPTSDSDAYGHVAFVESVNSDGTITVTEYNANAKGTGDRWTGKPSDRGFTKYVYFAGLMPPAPGGGSPGTTNTIKRIKKTTFGSTEQMFTATATQIRQHDWGGGSPIRTSVVATVPAGEVIVDFDKITQSDGATQSVYTATATGVYESWWNGAGFSNPAKIVNLAGVRRVVADLKAEGGGITHRLYVLAADGPYEIWWRDGGTVSNPFRLWNINNGFALVKSAAPTGEDEVYVASPGFVHEMTWPVPGGDGIRRRTVNTLTEGVDIQKHNKPDGTELLYTATRTGVHETWWNASQGFSNPAKIITTPGGEEAIALEKRITGPVEQIYLATKGHVYEYWWSGASNGTQAGPPLITITQNDVTDIDKSGDGNPYQNLYTVHQNAVYETWWGDGSVHTGHPIIVLN
ncbi:CHAP domain-containing protein [Longispora sp. NPDC051575]|uniref:CHAP domain-containing protein n=1 Tax=Longispora sp. NPDC051575 TaxID=3154943 RepID=UPI003431AB55